MKKILAAALLAFSTAAFAAPYPQQNMQSVITPERFSGAAADKIYNDLAAHAGEYPLRFDNAADQKRAARDAAELLRISRSLIETDIIKPGDEAYIPMLHRTAQTAWIAHNLDVEARHRLPTATTASCSRRSPRRSGRRPWANMAASSPPPHKPTRLCACCGRRWTAATAQPANRWPSCC